jgi:hypothetical protein
VKWLAQRSTLHADHYFLEEAEKGGKVVGEILGEHRARVAAKAPEMLALLAEVEYMDLGEDGLADPMACPVCVWPKTAGRHAPGCRLAAILKATEPPRGEPGE